jgi:hypothetical protein
VRDWIALEPDRVEPIIQLAAVQEDMKQLHVAEQTLVGTRQLYPDEIEVMKALSRFFARQASAASDRQPGRTEKENRADAQPAGRRGELPGWLADQGANEGRGCAVGISRCGESRRPRRHGHHGDLGGRGRAGRPQARMLRGLPMLEESAVAAVMQWRFAPVVVDGKPVPVRMTVTHNFSLR